jgi:hypothetical protein
MLVSSPLSAAAGPNAFDSGAFILTPQTSTIAVGQTVTLTATARFGPLPSLWEIVAGPAGVISMPRISVPAYGPASVSFQVTGLAPGTATLTYFTFSIGGVHGSGDIGNVTVVPMQPCVAPSIAAEPDDLVLTEKDPSSLSVLAAGTEPLTYQWEAGIEGGMIDPLPAATQSILAIPPVAPGTYHARAAVTNPCGTIASRLSTVRVLPCNLPRITQQPLSQAVKAGGILSLHVESSGSGMTRYDWYEGATGDTAKPVGSGNLLKIDAVTRNASYWVRLTNACGSVDSSAAVIVMLPARPRAAGR